MNCSRLKAAPAPASPAIGPEVVDVRARRGDALLDLHQVEGVDARRGRERETCGCIAAPRAGIAQKERASSEQRRVGLAPLAPRTSVSITLISRFRRVVRPRSSGRLRASGLCLSFFGLRAGFAPFSTRSACAESDRSADPIGRRTFVRPGHRIEHRSLFVVADEGTFLVFVLPGGRPILCRILLRYMPATCQPEYARATMRYCRCSSSLACSRSNLGLTANHSRPSLKGASPSSTVPAPTSLAVAALAED